MARPVINKNQYVATIPHGIGRELFVDSAYGSASYDGITPGQPLAGLDDAINRCSAGEAAVIHLMPNHAENIASAAAIAFDTAGIKVIGHGWGASRPTFTFTTATTATMTITAANIWLENILFDVAIDALAVGISITAADCTLKDIETRSDNASYQVNDYILTDANADRLHLIDWVHQASGGKTGAQAAITIVGGNDIVIIPKLVDGEFAVANISNETTACDSLRVFGRASHPAYLRNRHSDDVLVECVATTKGHIGPYLYGRLADNAANITEAFVGADMEFFEPLELVNLDGESSVASNITATVAE